MGRKLWFVYYYLSQVSIHSYDHSFRHSFTTADSMINLETLEVFFCIYQYYFKTLSALVSWVSIMLVG
jgi:hypothetical protein